MYFFFSIFLLHGLFSTQTKYGRAAIADVPVVPGDEPARPRRLRHEDHSHPTKHSAHPVLLCSLRNFMHKKMYLTE